jgi:hypothetical protein
MTPSDYKQCYLQLQVPVIVGEKVLRWTEVELSHYVLVTNIDKVTGAVTWDSGHPDNQAAHDAMLSKLSDHFATKGATLTVHVKPALGGIEHCEFETWRELWNYARKPFFGKGNPEEAQITLQLADRFGLLRGGTMQAYCDKYLGLDCNGFVGNYLVHGRREGDWQSSEPMGTDCLATKTIGVILRGNGAAVDDIDDLLPVNSYMLGLVGPSGNIIEQFEGNSVGHIVITQPPTKWETAYKEGKAVRQVLTMWAVESTGGVGLGEHGAQFVSAKDGIFTVKRFSHPNQGTSRFRVFRVL